MLAEGESCRIDVGDSLDVLRTLPAGVFQCCVTSPPLPYSNPIEFLRQKVALFKFICHALRSPHLATARYPRSVGVSERNRDHSASANANGWDGFMLCRLHNRGCFDTDKGSKLRSRYKWFAFHNGRNRPSSRRFQDNSHPDGILGLLPLDPQIGKQFDQCFPSTRTVNVPVVQRPTSLRAWVRDTPMTSKHQVQQCNRLCLNLLHGDTFKVYRLSSIATDTHRIGAAFDPNAAIRIDDASGIRKF